MRGPRLARFRKLAVAEQCTLLFAMGLLPLFWIGLRLLGLAQLRAWLHGCVLAPSGPVSAEEARRTGELVNVAARHGPFPATCLTRSLALVWLLGRSGVRSEVCLGVRMVRGELDAHAWVEHDGVPINDSPDVARRYAPFVALGAAGVSSGQ
jgi:hypothetical protein